METLNELGLKHGTDKNSTTHDYLDTYEQHLKEYKDREFTLLELGCASGNSIRMWREAYPKAKVFSIDINPECEQHGGVFIGSQTDSTFLDKVLAEIGIPDVIISDGSHCGDDEVFTFKHLFPKMKPGSIYYLEDTHTFYNEHPYSGPFESNGRTKAYNFFTDLVYHVDVAGRAMCGKQDTAINWPMPDPPVPEYSRLLKAIHFYPSLWLFQRK